LFISTVGAITYGYSWQLCIGTYGAISLRLFVLFFAKAKKWPEATNNKKAANKNRQKQTKRKATP
jgi:hypothetical protein